MSLAPFGVTRGASPTLSELRYSTAALSVGLSLLCMALLNLRVGRHAPVGLQDLRRLLVVDEEVHEHRRLGRVLGGAEIDQYIDGL